MKEPAVRAAGTGISNATPRLACSTFLPPEVIHRKLLEWGLRFKHPLSYSGVEAREGREGRAWKSEEQVHPLTSAC